MNARPEPIINSSLAREIETATHPLPLFKQALADHNDTQTERFRTGESAATLIHERAQFMDEILNLVWQRFTWNENLGSWRKTRISLLAVGGYGRAELHPHSDIDLLILLERNNYAQHKQNIQSFLTMLWDMGLEVGHSVRSVKECATQARADVTVLTALMECRTLCGTDELRTAMAAKITPKKMWQPAEFFKAKSNEQADRHQKSNHTELSLEPNVKTSPGGLRDIQTVVWIVRRQFPSDLADDLAALYFLEDDERQMLVKGRELLWKIRFGLHVLAGREEDRLLFEYQTQLAAMFGYKDGDQLAVEQFMQDYYRTAQQINTMNDVLLQHFSETMIKQAKRAKIVPINERFQLRNNYLETTSETVFSEHPTALLEMFVIMGSMDSVAGATAATIRQLRNNIHRIDDDFRGNPEATRLFMDLLGVEHHLFSQLRRMGRWGVLGAYLPEFNRVIGQMQFDLFHIYTVDAHTLQVVRNMRRFRYRNQEQQFPIAAHIHARLPKVELLYVAGLYHDIAKGMGGDHSELGVQIATDFCVRHGLGTWDTNLVNWLVQHHLVMSTTAQRKDIQDPEVIHEFAQFVQNQVRLDYLYALTVADINATNPTLWNGFRASLMSQLYLETKKMLRQGSEEPVDRDHYIRENQVHALGRLVEHGLSEPAVQDIWQSVDEDYFVHESVNDIVWHTQAIAEHDTDSGPLVLVRDETTRLQADEGSTQIFVHAKYTRDIFYTIVATLDQLALNVVDARIPSSDKDMTYYTFVVLEMSGQPVGENASRIERIRATLAKNLHPDYEAGISQRRTPRLLKQFRMKTAVSLTNDPDGDYTTLEVVAPDRPGLLAVLAQIFIETDVFLQQARITTLGERVEDVFIITTSDGKAITDPVHQERIAARIREELDEHVEKLAV